MELTLRITDANDLSKFAGLLSALFPLGAPTSTVATTANPAPARRGKTMTASSEPTEAEVAPALTTAAGASVAVATTTPTETATEEITSEAMRALVSAKIQANSESKAEIKSIVVELGGTSVSTIPAESRAEFIRRVNEL